MKKLFTFFAFVFISAVCFSQQITYQIKEVGETRVHLNSDRKTFIATVTLFVGVIGDTISPPFGEGTSFIIELKWAEAIPDSIDAKSLRYIENKYNK